MSGTLVGDYINVVVVNEIGSFILILFSYALGKVHQVLWRGSMMFHLLTISNIIYLFCLLSLNTYDVAVRSEVNVISYVSEY